tara:strand:+ start:145 stop:723 length:579 start_codon:yes stop_codon:yes gene_type:complete
MALSYAKIKVELREISLKLRPAELYSISPKGTVPVLVLQSGKVIDQSLDIMMWALDISDSDGWIENDLSLQMQMISYNDNDFKKWLDRYKYHDRYPDNDMAFYRDKCSYFLNRYDKILASQNYLITNKISIGDIAIFPFVRQLANVDMHWFKKEFVNLSLWLDNFLNSNLFNSVMEKYSIWNPDNEPQIICF